jgi:hypothetical protein
MDIVREFEQKITTGKKLRREKVLNLSMEYKQRIEEYKMKNGKPLKFSTITSRLSNLNMIVKSRYPEFYEYISKQVLPDRDEKKKQMKERLEKNVKRLSDREEFDYDEYIRIIDSLRTSKNYWDLVVLAIMTAGRRPTEIIARGSFEELKDDPHHVMFSGQLKKRRERDRKSFKIPILHITASEFIKLITKIRRMKSYSHLANTEVASRTNAYTNKRLRGIFERDLTCKTLRSVYAYIAYRLYGDDKISEIVYGAKILGHNDLDTNTFAQSYNHIFVTGIEPKAKVINKENVVNLLEELEKAIEKL